MEKIKRKQSEETKRKIGFTNSKKMKEYWKNGRASEKQISIFLYGDKHTSPEKLRIANLRRKEKYGFINSLETRQKISKSLKQQWANGEITEKQKETLFKKGFDKKRGTTTLSKNTSLEIKIQNYLKQLGIEFFTHQRLLPQYTRYQCDIFIPSMNLVIECDGNYWHKYPIGRNIDKIRTSELIKKGFKVLRLWGSEIKDMDLNKFKEKLEYVF